MKRLTLFSVLALLAGSISATIINVLTEQPTIQDGINAASTGDTVLVAPGTYSGPGNDSLRTYGKAILVKGDMDSTVIQSTGGSSSYAFYLSSNEDTNTVIKEFTIRGFVNGVYLENASPKLDSLRIEQCSNFGIFADPSMWPENAPIIRNCHITTNANGIRAVPWGPDTTYVEECWIEHNAGIGIEVYSPYGNRPHIIIKNCVVRGNDIIGIYYDNEFHGVPVRIDSCLLDSNTAALWGAFKLLNSTVRDGVNGIRGSGTAWIDTVLVDSCLFEGLTGYVFNGAARMTISNSTIQNNPGQLYTASIYTDVTRELNMINCEILNNGGGIELEMLCNISMTGCLYFGNQGGIDFPYIGMGGLEISGCVFDSTIDTVIFAYTSSLSYENSVQITDCLFKQNQGDVLVLGAEYGMDSSEYSVQNCTFANNMGSAVIIRHVDSTIDIINNNVAFNSGAGVVFTDTTTGTRNISCNDVYENTGGNYVSIPDQTGINGNISEDPQFCYPDTGNYYIFDTSPCAPANNSCSTLVGALDVGCCCIGMRGNVDYDPLDLVNIADVTYLVDYLFRGGPPPPCFDEADINGDGLVNIADLTHLVDFLFRAGPPPLPCS